MSQDLPQPALLRMLVIDDHELILNGTIDLLKQHYPYAELFAAKTIQDTYQKIEILRPDLVIIDLALPDTSGDAAEINGGIKSLRTLMKTYPTLNLVVQSSYVKALMRIKSDIDAHEGGFTVADKGLSSQEMLNRMI